MNPVDNKAIQSRYDYPGHLKLPVKEIHALPAHVQNQLCTQMGQFRDQVFRVIRSKKNECYKVPLTPNENLYIDYRNGRVNFYIEDSKNMEFTQLLTVKLSRLIEWREETIVKDFENYIKLKDPEQKRENNLVSTLVHSAYEARIKNRGSPTVFGKRLNNDFDLDR